MLQFGGGLFDGKLLARRGLSALAQAGGSRAISEQFHHGIRQGRGIAYAGIGGATPMDPDGEPTKASLGLFRYSGPGRVAAEAYAYTSEDVG